MYCAKIPWTLSYHTSVGQAILFCGCVYRSVGNLLWGPTEAPTPPGRGPKRLQTGGPGALRI